MEVIMRNLCIVSEQRISQDCQFRYRSIAFDGCNLYFSQPECCKICIYDLCMKPVCYKQTYRGYSSICYDFQCKCFWGSTDKINNKIYKLDKCFKEIGCVCLQQCRELCGPILSLSVNCWGRNISIVYGNGIMEADKETGRKIKVLQNRCSYYYTSVASSLSQYAFTYNTCDQTCLAVLCKSDCDMMKCNLDYCYKVEDMTMVNLFNQHKPSCEIYMLVTKKCCPYVLRIKIEDSCVCDHCDCDCDDECCHKDCGKGCTDIIESIASVEASIAHILNAEGEKIQKAISSTNKIPELLKINECVIKTITHVTFLEQTLYMKLEKIKEICCNGCRSNNCHGCDCDGCRDCDCDDECCDCDCDDECCDCDCDDECCDCDCDCDDECYDYGCNDECYDCGCDDECYDYGCNDHGYDCGCNDHGYDYGCNDHGYGCR